MLHFIINKCLCTEFCEALWLPHKVFNFVCHWVGLQGETWTVINRQNSQRKQTIIAEVQRGALHSYFILLLLWVGTTKTVRTCWCVHMREDRALFMQTFWFSGDYLWLRVAGQTLRALLWCVQPPCIVVLIPLSLCLSASHFSCESVSQSVSHSVAGSMYWESPLRLGVTADTWSFQQRLRGVAGLRVLHTCILLLELAESQLCNERWCAHSRAWITDCQLRQIST